MLKAKNHNSICRTAEVALGAESENHQFQLLHLYPLRSPKCKCNQRPGHQQISSNYLRRTVTITGRGFPHIQNAWSTIFPFTATRLPAANVTSLPHPGIHRHSHTPLPPPPEDPSSPHSGYSLPSSAASGTTRELPSSVLLAAYVCTKAFFFSFLFLMLLLPHPLPGRTPVLASAQVRAPTTTWAQRSHG